jgi:hypothetical protein
MITHAQPVTVRCQPELLHGVRLIGLANSHEESILDPMRLVDLGVGDAIEKHYHAVDGIERGLLGGLAYLGGADSGIRPKA